MLDAQHTEQSIRRFLLSLSQLVVLDEGQRYLNKTTFAQSTGSEREPCGQRQIL
jgi:hypothetical protein